MRFQQWKETETRNYTSAGASTPARLSWPDAVAYQESIQNPSFSLTDAAFQNARVHTDRRGLPVTYAGRFAVVFRLQTEDGEPWALRCFTTPGDGDGTARAARYQLIQKYAEAHRNIFVPFRYMERGIKVGRHFYPALAMRWASGEPLGRWIENHRSNPEALRTLCGSLSALLAKLEAEGIAHGDWQHDNLLVADEGRRLTLVDYDGMFVPELAGQRSEEIGHPNYQHPARTADHFGPGLDRFACLVIQTSLLGIAGNAELWDKYSDGESLLFQRSDFVNPGESPVFVELKALAELDQDELLADAVARLEDACHAGAMSTLLPGIDVPTEELDSKTYDPIRLASAWVESVKSEMTFDPKTTVVGNSVGPRQWWTLPEVVKSNVSQTSAARPRIVAVATQESFDYIERAHSVETLRAEENHLNSWRFGLALCIVVTLALVFAQNNGLRFFLAGPLFALLVNLGSLGFSRWPRKMIYDELTLEIEKMNDLIDKRKRQIADKGGQLASSGMTNVSDFVQEKMRQTSINRVLTVPGVKVSTLRVLREAGIDNAQDLLKRGTVNGIPPHQMTALLNWCQEREDEAAAEYRKNMGGGRYAPAEVSRLRHEVAEFERHLAHLKRERDNFPETSFRTYVRRLFGVEGTTANSQP
ncbi:MAG: hypothetical protein SFU56_12440 [Capsulimonadales bacterium]|nr:hypothetical protein [Capsulimonadales bacterium]